MKTQEKQLVRKIKGENFYCEALRGTLSQAKESQRIQKEHGYKCRIFGVSTDGQKMYGIFVN